MSVTDDVELDSAAVREMHRQVGDLQLDDHGIARRGLLIRHLVLPDDIAGTDMVLTFIADELSHHTYINLMDQYHPCYRAGDSPPLDRPLTHKEYQDALALADQYGLTRLDSRHSRRWLAF